MTMQKNEVLDRLMAGIAELTSSDRWQRWLDVQRRFHKHSFGNALLIQLQCPDATYIAGFNAWLQLGRHVRKGERAITIMAPIVRRLHVESEDGDPQVIPRAPRGFKPAHVFDVSQTDGEELPTVVHRLQGDDPAGAFAYLLSVAITVGFTIELVGDFPDERNGDCDHRTCSIRVLRSLSPAQRVKTLAHELAHAILHGDGYEGSIELAELEAESVAYVICDGFGVSSGEYSFGYVASWAGGGDTAIKAISHSGQRIVRAAQLILARGAELEPA